ncbi:hypothetical protein [Azospirillum largimobile]
MGGLSLHVSILFNTGGRNRRPEQRLNGSVAPPYQSWSIGKRFSRCTVW